MKALLFSLVLLGFVLSSTADSYRFIRSENKTCPVRPMKIVFYMLDCDQDLWGTSSNLQNFKNSYLAEMALSFQKETELNPVSTLATHVRDTLGGAQYGVCIGHRTGQALGAEFWSWNPVVMGRTIPPVPAYDAGARSISALLAGFRASFMGDVPPYEAIVVMFRWMRHNAPAYAPELGALKGAGYRIVTVDIGEVTRQEAIATASASDPVAETVFTYDAHPQMDTAAIVQAMRRDTGRTCVISSRTQVVTFDGSTYRHDGIGDYVIYKQFPVHSSLYAAFCPQTLEIQVRKSQCDDAVNRIACVTGVALRSAWAHKSSHTAPNFAVSFQYDRIHNDVAVTYQGELVPSDTLAEKTNDLMTVERIEPELGVRVTVKLPWIEGRNDIAASVLTAEFFISEDSDPVIAVHGGYGSWITSTGMCGTHDSCAMNDFVGPDGLYAVDNTTFVDEWRVEAAASIFEWTEFTQTNDPVSFTLRQPLYSSHWTSQAKKKNVGDPGLSKEARYLLCAEACERGHSGVAWINAEGVEEVCDDLCDMDIAAFEGLRGFDLHANFSKYVPAVAVAESNGGQRASVRIPVEGTYVFAVQSEDCCNTSEPVNVTLEVRCERDFSVDAGDDISLTLTPLPMPFVRIEGSLDGSNSDDVHFSWKIIAWPDMPESDFDLDSVPLPPALMYPNSLTPYFQPASIGNYTLQLVAFDGCHRAEDTMVVIVECLDLAFAMESSGMQIIWGGVSKFSPVTIRYFATCPAIGLVTNPVLETNVSLVEKAHDKFTITPISSTSWRVSADFNITSTQVYFNSTTTTVPDEPEVPQTSWLSLPTRNGFVRVEGERRRITQRTDMSVKVVQNVTFGATVHIHECTISTTTNSDTNDVVQNFDVAAAVWSSSPPPVLPGWFNNTGIQTDVEEIFALSPYGFGVCSAVYGVSQRLTSDSLCKDVADTFDLSVHCGADWTGPLSKPIYPCFVSKFDYVRKQFPALTVRSDSSDRWSRTPLSQRWKMVESPNNTSTPTDWVFTSAPTTATLTSLVEGKFELLHEVTNGCGYDSEDINVEFMCTGDVTAHITCPPASITWDYNVSVGQLDVPIYFNASGTTTALLPTSLPASVTVKHWIVTGPDGREGIISSGLSLSRSVRQLRNALPAGAGVTSFTVSAVLSDGCRSAKASCPLTVVCPSTLTPRPDVVNKTEIYTRPEVTSLQGVTYSTSVRFFETSEGNPQPITSWAWAFFRNQTNVGSASSPNGTATLTSVPGDYIAQLTISDVCHRAASNVSFVVKCPPNKLEPYVSLTKSMLHLDNGTKTFVADPTHSKITAFRVGLLRSVLATWVLTDPDGSTTTRTVYFTSVTSLLPQSFTVSKPGEYMLNLTFFDGCNSQSESVSVFVDCVATVTPGFAAVNPVKWSNNKFPVVTLDGSASQYTHARPSYYWYVLEAPKGSVFEGRRNAFAVLETDTHDIDYSNPEVNEWWTTHSTNVTYVTTTYTSTTFYETRLISRTEDLPSFGACFRPDLPGDYVLELQMLTACKTERKVLTVQAQCNEKPTILSKHPDTAHVWERVVLDASETTDPEKDDLSFEWSVELCTPEDPQGPTLMNDLLLNRRSPKAYFVPSELGQYCISLLVSDGCTPVWNNFTITVGCGEALPQVEEQKVKVKFDGLDTQKVNMEVDVDEDLDAAWYDSHYFTWTLVSFDSKPPSSRKYNDGEIAGIVVGSVAAAGVVAAVVAVIIVFKVMGGAASSGSKAVEMHPPAS